MSVMTPRAAKLGPAHRRALLIPGVPALPGVPVVPGVSLVPGKDSDGSTPDEILVASVVDQSAAELGWLAWQDSSKPIVVSRARNSPLHGEDISEFPEPPQSSLSIDRETETGSWTKWCHARGIQSCVVVPVVVRSRIVASMGLASAAKAALTDEDLQRLQVVASLAVHARRYEARLASLRRLLDEVNRTMENALALDRALTLPPTYREIARAVGKSLDATYCQIAIADAAGVLTIRAAGGHRSPRQRATVAWALAHLNLCSQALRERRAVVPTFNQHDSINEPERRALFSPTTRSGVLLPFFAGPRTQGILIIGEERQSRTPPLSPERVAILESVATRIGDIMRIARRLEYERLAERRRERRTTTERQRLARAVHDEIGQSLTGLLAQIRWAMQQGQAGKAELEVLERAACSALDGARALAYGFRHLERGVGPLEHARSFSETLLRAAGCTMSWTEDRAEAKVAGRTLREVSRVVKESVSNVVRHARAKRVRIRVEYPDGLIRVTIQDDGVGFVPRRVRPARDGRGLGLVGNAERLARVGGSFVVRSTPKGGTLVLLEAPRQ